MPRTLTALTALTAVALLLASAEAQQVLPGIGPVGDVTRVATGFGFTEGPAADAKGNLYFSDIRKNRIHKLDTDGKLSIFLEDTQGCNGLMFDQKERLIACQGGAGRVIAIDVPTKAITVVADKYNGKRFNAPNDLVIDSRGGVYFSDPSFGKANAPQDREAVYYAGDDGKVARVVPDLERPNGVLMSLDEKSLSVLPSTNQGLMAYPVKGPGEIGPGAAFGKVPGPGDGMAIDARGNLYVTQPKTDEILVLGPDGKTLGSIKIPEAPANCKFGGKDMQRLFVTARTSLYSVRLNVVGHRFAPPPVPPAQPLPSLARSLPSGSR
jgi:gluconolactonase